MANEKATTQTASDDLAATLEKLKSAIAEEEKSLSAGENTRAMTLTPFNTIVQLIHQAETLFSAYGTTLSSADRTRKVGAGIKNYGFIEAAYRSAAANPIFVPSYLNVPELETTIRDLSRMKTIYSELKQFEQLVSDSILHTGDVAYREALEYYNALREAARQNIPGAKPEYNLLNTYFKKKRTASADEPTEPTEAQIERDVRSLLHGTKEGRVVVENEKPTISAGKRKVVDDVHTERDTFRETLSTDEKV